MKFIPMIVAAATLVGSGACSSTAGKANSQAGHQAPNQADAKPGPKPCARQLATPETSRDIRPERIKPNSGAARG